uniref:G_PROTEIN_RECEP_F1_2 domain-containing protein n=1 Tax=Steinernema glaseri TaxID=37863 RepID=A0A1I7YFV9_9BILA
MFLTFYSHEVHTVCLTIMACFFIIISIFYIHVVLRKTPPSLSAYKFHFLYLNGCYQASVFVLSLFGPIEVTIQDNGTAIFEFYGLVQYLPQNVMYAEVLVGSSSLFSTISAVFLSFLFRYCQVCHPKCLYSTTPLIQNRVHAVLSTLVPLPLAVFLVITVFINSENVSAERPAIHVTVSSLLMAVAALISSVALAAMILCAIFIAYIWWTLYTKMTHASKKTKEMQQMLTITLIVCAAIPSVFGGIPLFFAIYAVVLGVEGTAAMFRLLFIAFIIQSVLNILNGFDITMTPKNRTKTVRMLRLSAIAARKTVQGNSSHVAKDQEVSADCGSCHFGQEYSLNIDQWTAAKSEAVREVGDVRFAGAACRSEDNRFAGDACKAFARQKKRNVKPAPSCPLRRSGQTNFANE